MTTKRNRTTARLRQPASERGFTLIELLVVIIILGILAAVVVFAVSGVGDKGKSSAVSIDERTIQTAEEAFCAKNGRYGSGKELIDGGFLSDLPQYHQVDAQPTGGPCNGWKFFILRTGKADPYPAGRWDPLALPPGLQNSSFLVRLPDGKVLVYGYAPDSSPVTYTWDPSTGAWAAMDTPPSPVLSNQAMLLRDDPSTPKNECAGATVNNCGKVLAAGKYLFNPNEAPGQTPPKQWETLPAVPGCIVCNPGSFGNTSTYVQFKGTPSQCGPNCGKIVFFGGATTYDLYDPTDNSYTSVAFPDGPTLFASRDSHASVLADGRVFICCEGTVSYFYDQATLSFTAGPVPPGRSRRGNDPQPTPVLPNGDVLFVDDPSSPRNTMAYTPQVGGSGTFRVLDSCFGGSASPRICKHMGVLSDGRVLSGRSFQTAELTTTQTYVYNPATSTWSRTGDLNNNLSYNQDALLIDPADGPCGNNCGKVMIAGLGSAELYTP